MSRSLQHAHWRSTNVERDIYEGHALSDYVPLPDRLECLKTLYDAITNGNDRAITITGPCGVGKSKDLVLLASVLDNKTPQHKLASKLLSRKPIREPWKIAPVTCLATKFPDQITTALSSLILKKKSDADVQTPFTFVRTLTKKANSYGPSILIIADELSRALEDPRYRDRNLSFLQDLAEALQRTGRRIVFLGALHRGFATYGSTGGLADDLEWIKVQGRFRDFPAALSFRDGFTLLAKGGMPRSKLKNPGFVAKLLSGTYRYAENEIAPLLAAAYPMAPLTSALLVSIGRTGVGQNNRGLVGSAEDLRAAALTSTTPICPWDVWTWVTENLGSALARSSLSHAWALATHCVGRAGSISPDSLRVAQTISLLQIFGSINGLVASVELLRNAMPGMTANAVDIALNELLEARVVTFRGYKNAYELYEGSDFRLDLIQQTNEETSPEDLSSAITSLLSPAIAKQHYHRTGTLRWFDIVVLPSMAAAHTLPAPQADGQLVVLLEKSRNEDVQSFLKKQGSNTGVFAIAHMSLDDELRRDLHEWRSLEHVQAHHPVMLNDPIARREVTQRLQPLKERIRQMFERRMSDLDWLLKSHRLETVRVKTLSELASRLADSAFAQAPIIWNELLNRHRPSPNAIAARRTLCLAMLNNRSAPLLGIDKYPPERALYDCLLERTGLHRELPAKSGVFAFNDPSGTAGAKSIAPVWKVISEFFSSSAAGSRPLGDLINTLAQPPYGLRTGAAPVLVLAALIQHEPRLAFYADGAYVPSLSSVWIDVFLKSPSAVSVRWIGDIRNTKDAAKVLLAAAAALNQETSDVEEALKISARFLHQLDPWTLRTQLISVTAQHWRDAFLGAKDPIQLLKDQLPALLSHSGASASPLTDAIDELRNFIPRQLRELDLRIRRAFFRADEKQDLATLRKRASRIAGGLGDLRLEALAHRLSAHDGSDTSLESLAGFLANKPLRSWIDRDWKQCVIDLEAMLGRLTDIEMYNASAREGAGLPLVVIHVLGSNGARRVIGTRCPSGSVPESIEQELEVTVRKLKAIGENSPWAEHIATRVVNALLSDEAADSTHDTAPKKLRAGSHT